MEFKKALHSFLVTIPESKGNGKSGKIKNKSVFLEKSGKSQGI